MRSYYTASVLTLPIALHAFSEEYEKNSHPVQFLVWLAIPGINEIEKKINTFLLEFSYQTETAHTHWFMKEKALTTRRELFDVRNFLIASCVSLLMVFRFLFIFVFRIWFWARIGGETLSMPAVGIMQTILFMLKTSLEANVKIQNDSPFDSAIKMAALLNASQLMFEFRITLKQFPLNSLAIWKLLKIEGKLGFKCRISLENYSNFIFLLIASFSVYN